MTIRYTILAASVAAAMLSTAALAAAGDNPELQLPRKVETATAPIQGTSTRLSYTVINGMALLGDIALGRHEDIQRTGIPPLFVGNWTQPVSAQNRLVAQDNHFKSATRWPNNTLYYTFDADLSQKKRDAIMAGMKLIADKTAIRFVPRTNQPNYAKFISSGGCWAYAGMQGGEQPISIGDGCEKAGVAAHEMIHTLGWMHEHMRPDRDNYITVNEDNISDTLKGQFTKLRSEQVDPVGSYDLDSVMHYPTWAFSKNQKPTITPKDPNVDPKRLGQRNDLSPGDVASLQHFYPGDVGSVELKLALSARELQIDQDKSGQLTLDIAGSEADLKGLKLDAKSDNEAVVASSGVSFVSAQGNQRVLKISPVAKAYGVANITVRALASNGHEATVSFKVSVAKDPNGGGNGGGNGGNTGGNGKPFDKAAKYKGGDQVTLDGKTYELTVIVKGQKVTNYFIFGYLCLPGSCSPSKPGNYGGLTFYWTALGDTGGGQPKPVCDATLDTRRNYLVNTAGQRKALVPVADVQGAPLILWQDGAAQQWQLQRNAEGYYSLISTGSKLALDVAGASKSTGAELIMATSTGSPSQQFCPRASGAAYQLVARHSGLSIGAANETDGSAITQAATGANWLLAPL
ncbi:M12 family metallopeptidase [Chitinimonas naiadis]